VPAHLLHGEPGRAGMDRRCVYVDRARSLRRGQNENDLGLAPGSRLPAYCTAMGKVLLANLPEKEQREVLASMKLTKARPEHDHQQGHAARRARRGARGKLRGQRRGARARLPLDRRARPQRGPRCRRRRQPGGAHLDDPLSELVDALSPHLVSTADRISARLGYRRDDEQQ